MNDIIDISCPYCGADFRVHHDLGDLYTIGFCIFCGEEINNDDYEWGESDEEWD